jgi:hypothetical protein
MIDGTQALFFTSILVSEPIRFALHAPPHGLHSEAMALPFVQLLGLLVGFEVSESSRSAGGVS